CGGGRGTRWPPPPVKRGPRSCCDSSAVRVSQRTGDTRNFVSSRSAVRRASALSPSDRELGGLCDMASGNQGVADELLELTARLLDLADARHVPVRLRGATGGAHLLDVDGGERPGGGGHALARPQDRPALL